MTTWVANPRVLHRRMPDGVILLAVSGGDPVFLEGTAEELWDLLTTPISLAAVARELADRHGAEVGVVENDIAAALDDLVARGLVLSDPPHPAGSDEQPPS